MDLYDDYAGVYIGLGLIAVSGNSKVYAGYKSRVSVSTGFWNSSTHRADISIYSWDSGYCNIYYYSGLYEKQVITVSPSPSYFTDVQRNGVVATLDSSSSSQIHLYATKVPSSTIYLDVFYTKLQ